MISQVPKRVAVRVGISLPGDAEPTDRQVSNAAGIELCQGTWSIERSTVFMMKTKAYVVREDDGSYSIYPDQHAPINYGLVGEGSTVEEAIADWETNYRAMKEFYQKKEKEFVETEFEFVYDVPSFLSYYGKLITFRGLSKITGISAPQLSQYASGYRNPSPKTAAKINRGLHRFAAELTSLSIR